MPARESLVACSTPHRLNHATLALIFDSTTGLLFLMEHERADEADRPARHPRLSGLGAGLFPAYNAEAAAHLAAKGTTAMRSETLAKLTLASESLRVMTQPFFYGVALWLVTVVVGPAVTFGRAFRMVLLASLPLLVLGPAVGLVQIILHSDFPTMTTLAVGPARWLEPGVASPLNMTLAPSVDL
ncbi:MAG: hypothetical protein HEQ38_09065 [Gemmatimonas sp.]|uniref:hypothetical protein n=1 Tax=Gemmatimonas sp. TaxID=1962908 RepID=UPI0031C804DB|nr:hypothetical protein [Gemmatimonas sp.]